MKSKLISAAESLATLARQAKSFSRRFRRQIFLLLTAVAVLLPLAAAVRLGRRPPATYAHTTAGPFAAVPAQSTCIVGSGQATAFNGVKNGLTSKAEVMNAPPPQPPARSQRLHKPSYILPGNTPAVPSHDPPTQPGGIYQTPLAPNDFLIKDRHDLTTAETSTLLETFHEPSLGNMDGTIFYTANRYAARSTDGGQTFTYVNPATTFPNLNGTFCCDQVVNYAPTQNMMLWLLQYNNDGSSNSLRLARAIGNQVAANTWTSYVFTPQDFNVGTGHQLDFPTATIGANFLYVTVNVHTIAGAFVRSVVMRIPLAQLAAGGNINYSYIVSDVGQLNSPRCVEGASTTIYWAALTSNTGIRIHRWDENSGTIFWDDVTVNSFVPMAEDTGIAVSPDGTNWAGKAQTKILAAYRRNGVLGFMWHAKQYFPDRPFPYTIVAEFSETTRACIRQQDLWSNLVAWLYPNVSVGAAGNLGGVINFGGGPHYPGTAAFLIDDVTPNITMPMLNLPLATSEKGPTDNKWGDYLTVRRHKTDTNTFVAGVY